MQLLSKYQTFPFHYLHYLSWEKRHKTRISAGDGEKIRASLLSHTSEGLMSNKRGPQDMGSHFPVSAKPT